MNQEDYFQRASFAGDLLSMALELPTPFSFGLDADWGAGKTFFINNILLPRAKNKGIPCVVYDAFEHEKDSDVFLSLLASILEQAQLSTTPHDKKLQNALDRAVKSASKVCVNLGRLLLNTSAKITLKHSIDEIRELVALDGNTTDPILGEAEKAITNFLEQRLQEGKSYKAVKSEFQNSMKSLACALSKGGKILVVIDELDRCTPIHALKVLEATNHILSTEGLVFLFSYHRRQLENMIEHTYGKGINSAVYLQKFITFSLQFPQQSKSIFREGNSKVIKATATFPNQNRAHNNILVSTLPHLDKINQHTPLTPRMLQSFTTIALAIEDLADTYLHELLEYHEIGVLIIFKITNPNALSKLVSRYASEQVINDTMTELKYFAFFPQEDPDKQSFLTSFLLGRFEGNNNQKEDIYDRLNIFNTLTDLARKTI